MQQNWQRLANHLKAEWRRFEDAELVDPFSLFLQPSEHQIEKVRQRELPTRAVVDAAVRGYVRGWPWPDLSDDEKFFLKTRLHFAWRMAESFFPEKAKERFFLPEPLGEDTQRVLEWLLIDVWPSLSFPIWLETQFHYYVGRAGGELTASCSYSLSA